MSLTLRKLQRMLSKSAKTIRDVKFTDPRERAEFAAFIKGKYAEEFTHPVLRQTNVREECPCGNCGPRTVNNITALIDRLTKRHGHRATLSQLLEPRNKFGQQQAGGGKSKGEPQEEPQQAPSGGFDPPPARDTAAEPPQPEKWEPTPPEAETPKPKTERENLSDEEKDLREQLAQLEKQKADAKARGGLKASAIDLAIKKTRKQLKDARKKASKISGVAGIENGPSLEARRRAAGTHGRLRVVPPQLRNKTAELINRLVHESGAAGDRLTPIPILSARKVVKRMLVRRPLGNAFKEDSNAGRPVTLFLPDVSPSCARQAQAACDVANAAGYAGVSGSDVLVFPHSNGEVEEDYVPWFNGRPNLANLTKTIAMFSEITSGRSRYNIRVVVAIGDHDAVGLYQEIAALKKVVRVVWLHNMPAGHRRPTVVPSDANNLYGDGWTDETRNKVTMIYGCVDQAAILGGLELALS